MTETKPLQVETPAGSLEQATERLNATIARAESVFATRFAVRGSVSLGAYQSLTFGKFDRKWRFAVETNDTFKSTSDLLANASREVRVKAVKALPDLFNTLELITNANTHEIETAVATADAFLSGVAS